MPQGAADGPRARGLRLGDVGPVEVRICSDREEHATAYAQERKRSNTRTPNRADRERYRETRQRSRKKGGRLQVVMVSVFTQDNCEQISPGAQDQGRVDGEECDDLLAEEQLKGPP